MQTEKLKKKFFNWKLFNIPCFKEIKHLLSVFFYTGDFFLQS